MYSFENNSSIKAMFYNKKIWNHVWITANYRREFLQLKSFEKFEASFVLSSLNSLVCTLDHLSRNYLFINRRAPLLHTPRGPKFFQLMCVTLIDISLAAHFSLRKLSDVVINKVRQGLLRKRGVYMMRKKNNKSTKLK